MRVAESFKKEIRVTMLKRLKSTALNKYFLKLNHLISKFKRRPILSF